jgi:peptidoglycan/LPS O-acetylase OafA/YrhL
MLLAPMGTDEPATRLNELDALRGIAALLVVCFHYSYQFTHFFPAGHGTQSGIVWGRYGVELFFAISGFVIFMTLLKAKTAGDFAVSRFARLFPAYWVAVLLTMAVVTLAGPRSLTVSWSDFALNLTMLEGFFYRPMVDGVYWTLTVELGFYATMLALWKLRWLNRIEWILLGWIGCKWLWWLFPSLPSRLGLVLIVEFIPFFAIGVLSFRVWSGQRRWRDQAPLLLFGLATVIVLDPAPLGWVFAFVAAVMVALERRWLSRLCARPFLWLGAISYPLYLIHENIGFTLLMHLGKRGVPPWIGVVVGICVALGLAHLLTVAVEQPALRAIRGAWIQWKNARVSGHLNQPSDATGQ